MIYVRRGPLVFQASSCCSWEILEQRNISIEDRSHVVINIVDYSFLKRNLQKKNKIKPQTWSKETPDIFHIKNSILALEICAIYLFNQLKWPLISHRWFHMFYDKMDKTHN